MRLFFAVELSPELVGWVRSATERLKPLGQNLRWTLPEKAHLTLSFLGELPDSRLPALREAARAAAAGRSPFGLAFGGLGAFDSWKKVKVVWAGVAEGAASLEGLAEALRRELDSRSVPLEKRDFAAHLTLARARTPGAQPKLASASLPPAPRLAVESLSLMLSRMGEAGTRYEALERFRLE